MNLCSTNHLRITLVSSARKYRLRTGVGRYYSNDHGRGRETNWDLVLGPLWLHVKWRPNGKSASI
jgi:hypothetical protein